MNKLSSDAQDLVVALSIVGTLLLLSFARIWFLLRTNRRLTREHGRMEQIVLSQHRDAIDLRRDSNAWRGAMQTQLDAFRAEASRRLEDAEVRFDQVIKQHEASMAGLQATLSEALSRKAEAPASPPIPAPASVVSEPAPSSAIESSPSFFAPPPMASFTMAPAVSAFPSDIVLPRIEEMSAEQ